MQKQFLRFLLFATLGFLVLYYIYYSQEKAYLQECLSKGIPENDCSLFNKLKDDFSKVNIFYVLLCAFIYLISNYLRAKRWEMLLKPLGVEAKLSNTLGATLIGYLVNLAIPRAGELARASAFSRNEDLPFDKSFGTVVTDRLVDMVCLITISLLTLLLAYDVIIGYFEKHLDISAKLASLQQNSIIIGILVIGFFSSFYFLYKLRNVIFQTAIGQKVKKVLDGILQGLLSIKKVTNPTLFTIYSIGIWASYFLMAYVMFKAYPPTEHLGLIAGLIVFFFGSLGVVFPSPGGMGSYQFLVIQALSLYNINSNDSFLYANLMFFAIQIISNLVFGGLAFLWMGSGRLAKGE